jgi:hypothetical protein
VSAEVMQVAARIANVTSNKVELQLPHPPEAVFLQV